MDCLQLVEPHVPLYLADSPSEKLSLVKDRCLAKVRELYVLAAFGTPFCHIQHEYGISPGVVDEIVSEYEAERQKYLNQCPSPSDVLLGCELLARLKVSDRHILGYLRDLGAVAFVYSADRRHSVPLRSSVEDYLGDNVHTIFYTTREVSQESGLTVSEIDRRAKILEVGRKVKPDNKHSNYLLTREEIGLIRSFRRPWSTKWRRS